MTSPAMIDSELLEAAYLRAQKRTTVSRQATAEPSHPRIRILEETGSTNSELINDFAQGRAQHGAALFARHQTQARGRLGRNWQTAPDTALLFSLLLLPEEILPPHHPEHAKLSERMGLIPLATGAALAQTIRQKTGIDATLKWPNDLLVNAKKLAGILCQVALDRQGRRGVVIGVGLNVRSLPEELPVPTATSLRVEGAAEIDINELAAMILTNIMEETQQALLNPDLARVEGVMSTLGQRVRAQQQAEGTPDIVGRATALNQDGSLQITGEDGTEHSVNAGDIWHLRPEKGTEGGYKRLGERA